MNNFNVYPEKESFFKKWLSWNGTETRTSYFKKYLIVLALTFVLLFIALLLLFIANAFITEEPTIAYIFIGLALIVDVFMILLTWSSIVLGIRRGRDAGLTGRGYLILSFIPFFSLVVLFLPSGNFAQDRRSFFFRQKSQAEMFGYMYQGGYANQQYTQNPQQANGMQGSYVDQEHINR